MTCAIQDVLRFDFPLDNSEDILNSPVRINSGRDTVIHKMLTDTNSTIMRRLYNIALVQRGGILYDIWDVPE